MKFSCVKEYLEKAVAIAERFTGKNITLPILANLLLETEGNNLVVTATNLEYAVQIIVPGKTGRPGKVSVPAKILNSLIQTIREEKVDFEEKQGNLFVRTDTRDTRLNGLNPEEFPILPKVKKTSSFRVESYLLKQGIEKVLPAVSASEFKPELAGVFFNFAPRTLRLAATDTFRLAEKTISLDGKDGESFSFILPQRVALELARVLQDKEEIKIGTGENQALFEAEGIKIISRLIEGNFPEYGGIIPKQFENTSHIKREEYIQAVRSASIFSSKIQEVVLKFKEKILEIASANAEVGQHHMTIPVASGGKEISISFNYRYLLDGLSALDEEELFMGVNSENTPSLLRNKEDGSFLYVLMPIRLS